MAFIAIGMAPSEEAIALPTQHRARTARRIAEIFRRQLRRALGEPPDGVDLRLERVPAHGGSIYWVVCYFEPDDQKTVAYAWRCEAEAPTKWDARALDEIARIAALRRE